MNSDRDHFAGVRTLRVACRYSDDAKCGNRREKISKKYKIFGLRVRYITYIYILYIILWYSVVAAAAADDDDDT